MGKTKKVHSTGRFGARYGVKIRKRVKKIELEQKKKHECPYCGKKTVKRKATGLYFCKKCKTEFTGGAYVPETMVGATIKRMVSQKQFLPELKSLLELKEAKEKGEETEVKEEEKTKVKEKEEK